MHSNLGLCSNNEERGESCSMNLGLGSKRKRGKVVDTGYPTGLLVEKGNNGKTQYKLDKEQIYY